MSRTAIIRKSAPIRTDLSGGKNVPLFHDVHARISAALDALHHVTIDGVTFTITNLATDAEGRLIGYSLKPTTQQL